MKASKQHLNAGIIGTGFVSDFYMHTAHLHPDIRIIGAADRIKERSQKFCSHYKIPYYESAEALLANKDIDLIINLTNPHSHYEISKQALLAGKHVYCEKPMAMELEEARELCKIAEERNLIISNAPCSLHSSAAQTVWKSIKNGDIGNVKVVYAEMDDGPVHLMNPDKWKSKLGNPWPYEEEFNTGCTIEHIGYCLSWVLAMFGPAKKVSAFSHCLLPDKMPGMEPVSSPDFSVACIEHESGVVTRLTCGIMAPVNRSLTVVGEKGIIKLHDFWDNYAPVKINTYTSMKLKAERKEWINNNWLLKFLFGLNFKKIPLLINGKKPSRKITERIKMDYLLGVSDVVKAVLNGTKPFLDGNFSLHVTELTLKIHNAYLNQENISVETGFGEKMIKEYSY